jgi:hypothetical protein
MQSQQGAHTGLTYTLKYVTPSAITATPTFTGKETTLESDQGGTNVAASGAAHTMSLTTGTHELTVQEGSSNITKFSTYSETYLT